MTPSSARRTLNKSLTPSSGVLLAACTHGVHELADTPTGGDTPPPGNVPTHVDIDPFPTPAPALPEVGATLSPLTQHPWSPGSPMPA
jgi:hypothetical protein